MFEGICEALHREMEQLDEKFSKGAPMNGQELEHIEKMAHALKSLKAYERELMQGNSEMSGNSYARGRSRMTGRYISRDEGPGYSGYNSQDPDGYGRDGYRRY